MLLSARNSLFLPSMSTAAPSTLLPPKASDGRPSSTQEGERKVDNFDLLNSIQASKDTTGDQSPAPYVHPLVGSSSTSLSQRSLEMCTESLGSETGSDGFSDIDDCFSSSSTRDSDEIKGLDGEVEPEVDGVGELGGGKECLAAVNYHCSIGRGSPLRSFPPPLPSISRRDGPCVHMRSHRRDGRLVVEAMPVPSQNYLHCQRRDGRLLLTFIETTFEEIYPEIQASATSQEQQGDGEEDVEEEKQEVDAEERERKEEPVTEEEEEEEEEVEEEKEEMEEVEVLDRGIVVEVKVRGGMKSHKSSLVINKFVSGIPLLDNKVEANHNYTTARVAKGNDDVGNGTAVKASLEEVHGWGTGGQKKQQRHPSQDIKLLFTSKKLMNRQALLHQVRRCSYQHRPLFFWEGCCIATTG